MELGIKQANTSNKSNLNTRNGDKGTVVYQKYQNSPRYKVTISQRSKYMHEMYSIHHSALTDNPKPLIRYIQLNIPPAIQHKHLKKKTPERHPHTSMTR